MMMIGDDVSEDPLLVGIDRTTVVGIWVGTAVCTGV